jgi:hypothetical protein
MTKPLRCVADDGCNYIVKFDGEVTIDGLVREWFGAQLAMRFGLPVPEFAIAELDAALASAFDFIGSRPVETAVFASKELADVSELTFSQLPLVPKAIQEDVFVFDLWMRHNDRNLAKYGGNVNLLWSVAQSSLHVIDHNLVWEFDVPFAQTHVFYEKGNAILADMFKRQRYEQRLQVLCQHWDDILTNCPQIWLCSELFTLDMHKIQENLNDYASEKLWSLLP